MAQKYDMKDFNARVKRIQNPRNKSYYDPDMGMHIPKRVSAETIRKNAKARKFSLSSVLTSLLIGVVAVMIAQAFRFRYLGMAEVGNAALATDLLLTAFLVLLGSAFLRHRKVSHRFAQAVGVVAMVVAGHNLMWYYPAELAIIYSTEYVDQVRGTTEPLSLVFRDMTISL